MAFDATALIASTGYVMKDQWVFSCSALKLQAWVVSLKVGGAAAKDASADGTSSHFGRNLARGRTPSPSLDNHVAGPLNQR